MTHRSLWLLPVSCLVLLFGCATTQAPVATAPSVTAEQFETPSPSPTVTPTDAQMLPRSTQAQATTTASPDTSPDTSPGTEAPVILKPEEVVGTYTCKTLVFKPADALMLKADGTYKLGDLVGKYSRETDTKLTWIDGEIGLKYQRTSAFVFYAKPPSLNLVSLGNDRKLDLICKRDESLAPTPTASP